MMRARGAALLLVLWLLVLLTGVISVFALSARTEALQGRFLGRSVSARYIAEAGIEVAVMRLQGNDDATRWAPDGRVNEFEFEGMKLQVRVVDESGKVDLNAADADVLVGVMRALGVEEPRARQLSGAIMDWRDADNLLSPEGGAEDPEYAAAGLPYGAKDRPFQAVSELRQVLGMDEAIYRVLVPYLTVFTNMARPDTRFAAEPVLRGLGLTEDQIAQILVDRESQQPGQSGAASQTGNNTLAAQGTGTYSIRSRATRPDGTQAEINATLRLGTGGSFGLLYTPLSWRVGEPD